MEVVPFVFMIDEKVIAKNVEVVPFVFMVDEKVIAKNVKIAHITYAHVIVWIVHQFTSVGPLPGSVVKRFFSSDRSTVTTSAKIPFNYNKWKIPNLRKSTKEFFKNAGFLPLLSNQCHIKSPLPFNQELIL